MENSFLRGFLKISTYESVIAIVFLVLAIYFMYFLKNKKVSFSSRMLIGLVLGLGSGLLVEFLDMVSKKIFNFDPGHYQIVRTEISLWYQLVGVTFVKLIQLMAVPVVFFSIFFVILDFKGKNIRKFTAKTLTLLLGTTAISAFVGILITKVFNLSGGKFSAELAENSASKIAVVTNQSLPSIFKDLIPSNIFQAFSSNSSIISVVIIGVIFAQSAKFLRDKKPEKIEGLISIMENFKTLINSVLTNIIKLMPYAVIALVGNTIISKGLVSILGVLNFIVAIYVAIFVMMLIYVPILIFVGVNPVKFYKKAIPTLIFAFSSRSSVGTLPYTLDTLENKMGVSNRTAKFIGSLSTTVGMNGCAGVFPAMLGVIIAGTLGVTMDIQFYVLVIFVVTMGSIGIAGVPGTSTVAATVTINGLGFGKYFSLVGSIFGIDPIIDMGRTMLNVCGAMVSAVVVDIWEGTFDKEVFNRESDTNE